MRKQRGARSSLSLEVQPQYIHIYHLGGFYTVLMATARPIQLLNSTTKSLEMPKPRLELKSQAQFMTEVMETSAKLEIVAAKVVQSFFEKCGRCERVMSSETKL